MSGRCDNSFYNLNVTHMLDLYLYAAEIDTVTIILFQAEMTTLLQQYSVNNDLISEIERLQDENRRLKRIF